MYIDLDRMGPGTDYHGLIEKVAYRLWLGCHNAADWCWEKAKQRTAIANTCYPDKFGDPYSFYQRLQQEAFHIKNKSPDGAWYAALDQYADLVMTV